MHILDLCRKKIQHLGFELCCQTIVKIKQCLQMYPSVEMLLVQERGSWINRVNFWQ